MAYGLELGVQPAQPSPWNAVNIEKVVNGFIVRVGCRTFVSKDWDEVNTALGEYWMAPETAKKKYLGEDKVV